MRSAVYLVLQFFILFKLFHCGENGVHSTLDPDHALCFVCAATEERANCCHPECLRSNGQTTEVRTIMYVVYHFE